MLLWCTSLLLATSGIPSNFFFRVIFFACLVADILWILTASRHSNTTSTSAPMGAAPVKQEEAGIPMSNQQTGASSDYYSGQPTQQQGGYQQQPMTQGQYPPQYSQGQTQQQYPQGQAMPPQQQQFSQQGNYVTPKEGAKEVYSPSHTPAPQ